MIGESIHLSFSENLDRYAFAFLLFSGESHDDLLFKYLSSYDSCFSRLQLCLGVAWL